MSNTWWEKNTGNNCTLKGPQGNFFLKLRTQSVLLGRFWYPEDGSVERAVSAMAQGYVGPLGLWGCVPRELPEKGWRTQPSLTESKDQRECRLPSQPRLGQSLVSEVSLELGGRGGLPFLRAVHLCPLADPLPRKGYENEFHELAQT